MIAAAVGVESKCVCMQPQFSGCRQHPAANSRVVELCRVCVALQISFDGQTAAMFAVLMLSLFSMLSSCFDM